MNRGPRPLPVWQCLLGWWIVLTLYMPSARWDDGSKFLFALVLFTAPFAWVYRRRVERP